VKLIGKRTERLSERSRAADDHEGPMGRGRASHRAVRFPQPSPGPVPLYGPADLPTHGKAGAPWLVSRSPQYDHRRPVNSLAPLEERLKFSAGGQPFASRKPAGQTVSRFRPFARRRLSTFRPPFVFIRSRKP
jgi:hypothetical protein